MKKKGAQFENPNFGFFIGKKYKIAAAFDLEEFNKLLSFAEKNGTSVSASIRNIVKSYLKKAS